jgi:hypothetical protein
VVDLFGEGAPAIASPTPRKELERVLDPEHAQAVIDHRKAKRAPLTAYAAKLLAAQLARWHNPNEAADAMILNGWQAFKPEWMERQSAPRGQSARGTDAHRDRLRQEIDHEQGYRGTEDFDPRPDGRFPRLTH